MASSRCAICAPRWSSAAHLRAMLAQGSLSDNARLYARDNGITIVQDNALAALLLAKP